MIGGLFFIPMVSLLGILIARYRRDPRRFLDGPVEVEQFQTFPEPGGQLVFWRAVR